MAIVTMIVGSMFGLLSGISALIFGAGVLSALALWVSVALAATLLAGVFALLPRRSLTTADA